MNCPECDAPIRNGVCRDYFDACLSREFSDRAYWPVHNLTVAAYMLQHPSLLSHPGWLTMRQTLMQFFREGISPASYRHEFGRTMQNRQRDFRFNTGEPILLEGVVWTKTIADVRLIDADNHIADIRAWAEAVLSDTAHVQ